MPSSDSFRESLRSLDAKVNVTNATIAKVPFDLDHWQKVSAEKYPNGLPEPESDDPTQWLFHGRPEASTHIVGSSRSIKSTSQPSYLKPSAYCRNSHVCPAWCGFCATDPQMTTDSGIGSSLPGRPARYRELSARSC
jgi:hypothetical protein